MTLGTKIARLRKEQQLTQKDLAEKLNVSDKVISRWETGVSLPDVEMMKKLSKIFQVTIAELYDALDEDDDNTDEKENYERIWQYYDYERIWHYKRSTVIACALFCMATLLAVLTLLICEYAITVKFVNMAVPILATLSIALAFVSIPLKVVSALSLSSFSKTKYYRTLYEETLKKHIKLYAILCAICVAVVILVYALILLIP